MTDERKKHNSEDITKSKLLSVVVTGRNDNYMGNFKYRIITCLNYLACNLRDIERLDDVEVLVTDWGSDVPLAKVLPLSPEAGRICRFVYVHPTITRAVQPDGSFCQACAVNVSLRRGKGEFLALLDTDGLFPRHSLQVLLDLLDGKLAVPFDINRMFFLLPRYKVPWEVMQREPTLEEWDRYLLLNAGSLPRAQELSGLGMASSGQMMHRSLWHACRGYDQQLRYWGWSDAELTLRVTQYYPWVDLSSLGVSLFHMEHWPRNRPVSGVQRHNPHYVSPTFEVNDENWGLANYKMDIQTAENIVESFRTTKSSGIVSQTEPGNKTRRELVAELTNHVVRKHAQTVIQSWRVNSAEWESLCALSWYSLYYYPRAYLEFGIQNAQAAAVVSAACPGVEIYGIDSWQASNNRCSVPPPDYVASMLRRVGYRGYMRFVSGDACTAFRRLQDSSVGPLLLDFALVRGDMFGADVTQQLKNLVPHMAPGGMVVFTCASTDSFQRVWSEMQARFAQFTYLRCKTGRTGLILAASLQNDDLSAPSDAKNDLVDFGKPPRFVGLMRQFRSIFCRIYRALNNPTRYPEYAKRIYRLALPPSRRAEAIFYKKGL